MSNYEFIDISLQLEEEERKIISTSEFWNLTVRDSKNDHYHYHIMNNQTYFLKKIANVWKIWDNYNPNTQELVKIK